MSNLRTLIFTGLLGGLTCLSAQAQNPGSAGPASQEATEARERSFLKAVEDLGWTREGIGKLGTRAEVAIPKGYRFTNGDGTRKLMTMTRNFPTQKELGMLATEDASTWIIFEWEDSGYVKDDDKDELDPDATLKMLQEGTEASNEKRKELGMGELHLVGWAVPLHYNDQTKNLEWATRLRNETGSESINYNTRLLGREGVMEVTLVCTPEEMQSLLPQYQSIISSFKYVEGQTYAEYRAGDKIAKYGVTGLVAAGGAVLASKMGLFAKLGVFIAKLGKGIVVLVVAVGVGIKALFSKLFGRRAA
jgi:uncharacterized membrane-anchored protein